ncbi:BatD family protein [Catenovulum adriaticum]|uniref:BatD family protein n=1 Tax=Catenovulum adriaticum TaxID=2984846 RepID=A0ABY7AS42_9ALTE|nr:BatD family protein [Catenovulum sp. TS8]WAJ72083.1 BatD family protein [Catenovulum sp. TS8]
MTNIIIICASALLSFNAAALSRVTASVNENPIQLNESVDLVIAVDDKVDSDAFDFSVLESNFRLLGTSVSSETRMINFKTTRITRFTTRLMPKKAGNLTIPEFSYQGISSNPISLQVTQNASSTDDNKRIYVETELSQNDVWLQQQVTYTTRLFLSVQISSGSLTQPEIEGALVEQEGKDKEYDKIINGVAYRVIERTYKVIPQRSGQFSIQSPVFQAEVVENARRQFGFNRTKTISRVGPDQTLNVKAIPNHYVGHWLPSEMVMLNSELEPKQQEYYVGEPITRVITLSALDVSEEQLPEINAQYPADIKVYPDQAEVRTNLRGDQYISQRVETQALIPSQAGSVTLPAIEITWWNTKTEKMQTTQVDAQTINVVANPSMASTPTQPAQIMTPPAPNQADTELSNSAEPDTQDDRTLTPASPAPVSAWSLNYLVILFVSLWLITLGGLLWVLFNKQKDKSDVGHVNDHSQSEKLAWSRLQKACQKNQIEQIQTQLPIWVAAIYQTPIATSHQALAQLDNPNVNEQINAMQASRFSPQGNHWQAQALLIELKKIRQTQLTKQQPNTHLAKLNP